MSCIRQNMHKMIQSFYLISNCKGVFMYANTGYYYQNDIDKENLSRPLLVANCGTYRLHSRPVMRTYRPEGRQDYQLLYIASGKASFYFNHTETVLSAGQMVLYRPGVPQHYCYYAKNQPAVFWVHFTGNDVEHFLTQYGFKENEIVFSPGICPEFHQLFSQMILELQLRRPFLEDYLSLTLQQLFLIIQRRLHSRTVFNQNIQKEVENAIHFFNEHYNTPIIIEDYAAAQHMSTCWFIRSFKKQTGKTPMQYITSTRIARAQGLLESTDYNISEIASIVGYENPLYFSRIFKKLVGVSPRKYRG